MNWLAHVFLSENHIEHQLGNLLTDPLKGKAWEGASTRIHAGIKMHMRIDSFTDTHPLVSESKKILTPRGHLKGVVLDILYDHFLSLHWNSYCTIEREHFLDDFRFHALESIGLSTKSTKRHQTCSRQQTVTELCTYGWCGSSLWTYRQTAIRKSPEQRQLRTLYPPHRRT